MKNRSAILSVCAVSMFITVYNLKAIFLGYIEVQETQPTFWGWNPKNEKDVVHAFQPFSSSSQAQIRNNTYTCRLGNGTVIFPLLPHFIIVGAQKAGTTALAEFLDMVPGLQGTIKREPHYWDLEAPKRAPNKTEAASIWKCRQYRRYADHWDNRKTRNGTMLFEKTPKLLALPHVPSMIPEILPHIPKIIVILRDPIARAYSHYKMTLKISSDKRKIAVLPFGHRVAKTIHHLRSLGVNIPIFDPNATGVIRWEDQEFSVIPSELEPHLKFTDMLLRGCYSRQISNWMQHFDLGKSLKVLQYERLERNQSEVLQDLLTFVGGPPHNLSYEILKKDFGPTRSREKKPADSSFVPTIPFKNTPWSLRKETVTYLKHFYKPYNDELANLLGENWRGIWD